MPSARLKMYVQKSTPASGSATKAGASASSRLSTRTATSATKAAVKFDRGPAGGNPPTVPDRVSRVLPIPRARLRPPEAREHERDGAERIDVRERIQGEAPEPSGGGVA